MAPPFRSIVREYIFSMSDCIKKIVGTKNDREIKRIRPYVDEINKLEPEYERLSDAELKAKTDQFKNRHS